MLKFWDTKLQSCINPVTVHTSHTLEPVSHKQLQEACRPIKLCSHFDCLKMFSIYVIFMCQDIGLPIPGIHYDDVIMSAIASQTTSLTIVYSIVYSDADQRKHQSSASLAFVWEFHRGPVNSPHKWSVTRKMFPFDDVIMSVNELK